MKKQVARVLVVGRSPSVLTATVEIMRTKGYIANATNQFASVLEDYDAAATDVLVFGGMVPPETKQRLGEQFVRANPDVSVLQGMVGIAGVIASQVDGVVTGCLDDSEVQYDADQRTFRIGLADAARVVVEAFWMTSWRPPEPGSTSQVVFDGKLAAGSHTVAIPDEVPAEASFAAVTIDDRTRVLTVGPLPTAVTRMVPKSADDQRLPAVAPVTTHHDS